MAKPKNHTNHNQNRKAHGNGIKRPMRKRHESTMGMDVKFLTNQRFARRNKLSRAEADQRYKDRMAAQAGKEKPVFLQ
ncbi:large ribosomal subunit protein eL29-like [Haematobia irritans]|uniref:large ribosomal subunit protein eL29-like n=1 Tax=Haematobia irritans TaxID=7368 RepID=UPI003F503A61